MLAPPPGGGQFSGGRSEPRGEKGSGRILLYVEAHARAEGWRPAGLGGAEEARSPPSLSPMMGVVGGPTTGLAGKESDLVTISGPGRDKGPCVSAGHSGSWSPKDEAGVGGS